MALDSTVKGTAAESYISVAVADAYHAARDNASWASTTAAKEAALRKATQHLEASYDFKGARTTVEQRLAWPRSGIAIDGVLIDADTMPQRLVEATAELAARAVDGELAPDLDPLMTTKEKVGPIETEYSESQRGSGRQVFDLVERLLRPLVRTSTVSGSIPVVRA